MSVESKLKKIADERFPDFSWVVSDWRGADKLLAKMSVPAIVCLLPEGGSLTCINGRVTVAKDCLLAFLTKVPRDANGEDNVAAYEEMLRAAMQFYGCIIKSGEVSASGDGVEFSTIYEDGANILTGVLMSVRVRDNERMCI